MNNVIYADNAATTKLDEDAFEAMKPFLIEDYANPSQPYSFSRNAKNAIREARENIAECIGAFPEEIFFTSGGTESDNWAIKGMMQYGDFRATITSQIEHHAVLNACAAVERMGFPVVYLPTDRAGIVEPDALSQIISRNTKIVSIMAANNEIGTIQPISELAKTAHKFGALFHTDAVQAVGHIPIDVKALEIDMLSASAHKFNGPKGVGFLYVKSGTPLGVYADGGSQEHGMRAGTENVAGIVGMSAALKKNCAMMEELARRLNRLEEIFLQTLDNANVEYLRNGDKDHLPGLVSISIKGAQGEMLLHRLDLKGISVSTGAACNSVKTHISHVLQAIGLENDWAEGTLRVSFGRGNSEDDAVQIGIALVDILRKQV